MSTDGTKIVISRVKAFDHSVAVENFELPRGDVEAISVGTFKSKMRLRNQVPGLTRTMPELFISLPFSFVIIGAIQLYRRRKKFNLRVEKGLNSMTEFKEKLGA
jgi:hypothetical protein